MHTGPVGCQYVLDQNWFWLPIRGFQAVIWGQARVSAEKVTEK